MGLSLSLSLSLSLELLVLLSFSSLFPNSRIASAFVPLPLPTSPPLGGASSSLPPTSSLAPRTASAPPSSVSLSPPSFYSTAEYFPLFPFPPFLSSLPPLSSLSPSFPPPLSPSFSPPLPPSLASSFLRLLSPLSPVFLPTPSSCLPSAASSFEGLSPSASMISLTIAEGGRAGAVSSSSSSSPFNASNASPSLPLAATSSTR